MIVTYFRKRYDPQGGEKWFSENKDLLPIVMWPEMHPDGYWHCTDENTGEQWLVSWPGHNMLVKKGIEKEYAD